LKRWRAERIDAELQTLSEICTASFFFFSFFSLLAVHILAWTRKIKIQGFYDGVCCLKEKFQVKVNTPLTFVVHIIPYYIPYYYYKYVGFFFGIVVKI